ncbi:PRC-barrel domain-containing protein [Acuticoccus sp. M5D2P5]|uniref:PRC-barrel domain-containing protein n=1 Tax=Acuticoccus kalidii TaxID=2910977 RepID=UPI001F37C069|nr:PRC-barrel domain-containing protein [Acuticoccus kalidii]MCF3934216.1 PRC-barrel domain-containing protein [Acuticoccus kalidii]
MAEDTSRYDTIRAGRVVGTPVFSTEGQHLGTVEDIVIGKDDGRVRYAIMSFGGFLGIGEEYHPLPWDLLHYDETKEGYVVPVSRDQLEKAPRFPKHDEPNWQDDTYHRDIHGFYGRTLWI